MSADKIECRRGEGLVLADNSERIPVTGWSCVWKQCRHAKARMSGSIIVFANIIIEPALIYRAQAAHKKSVTGANSIPHYNICFGPAKIEPSIIGIINTPVQIFNFNLAEVIYAIKVTEE